MSAPDNLHIYQLAEKHPEKPAIIMSGSGEIITFGALEERSNQGAQLFRSLGLKFGDTIAIFLDNSPRYFEIAWAAQRSGLYFTCISSRLTAPEVQYILEDSGASVMFSCPNLSEVAKEVKAITSLGKYYSVDGNVEGFDSFEAERANMPTTRIADEAVGTDMLYSSGTTGRPKGLRPPLNSEAKIEDVNALSVLAGMLFRVTNDSTYLSPAPLYHAAPLRWCMSMTRFGTTLVIMEKFDPEDYLRLIDAYKITHSQTVPTMFVKMLKLPEAVRAKYDMSSLSAVVHAAAPCPIPVKQEMIEWWGPVIEEYYAGSEGNGMTWIGSDDWMNHKGSVGRAILGELHICSEEGDEVPVGEEGQIYFGGTAPPTYHNAPEKTKGALNPKHEDWSSLGDVGKVDEEGFLYLTDRKAFMIISGGVNIYPQETENILITHPKVADCAVIGIPNEEFGEEVKAVVQPMPGLAHSEELAAELIEFCQANLAKIKCPKSVDFDPELPRHPTGKLYKRLIRDRYWGKKESRIV